MAVHGENKHAGTGRNGGEVIDEGGDLAPRVVIVYVVVGLRLGNEQLSWAHVARSAENVGAVSADERRNGVAGSLGEVSR